MGGDRHNLKLMSQLYLSLLVIILKRRKYHMTVANAGTQSLQADSVYLLMFLFYKNIKQTNK